MNNENDDMLSEAQKDLDLLVEELLKGEHREIEEKASEGEIRDSKTIVCKSCGEKVDLVCKGKFPNGTKKWLNSDGKIANGKMCADCNTKRAKSTMKRIRSKDK